MESKCLETKKSSICVSTYIVLFKHELFVFTRFMKELYNKVARFKVSSLHYMHWHSFIMTISYNILQYVQQSLDKLVVSNSPLPIALRVSSFSSRSLDKENTVNKFWKLFKIFGESVTWKISLCSRRRELFYTTLVLHNAAMTRTHFFSTGSFHRDLKERGRVDEANGGDGRRNEGRRNYCATRHVRLSSALYIRSGTGPCDTRLRTWNNGCFVLNCVWRHQEMR